MNVLSPAPAAPRSSCSRWSTPSSRWSSKSDATVGARLEVALLHGVKPEGGGVQMSGRPAADRPQLRVIRAGVARDDAADERDALHVGRVRRERQVRANLRKRQIVALRPAARPAIGGSPRQPARTLRRPSPAPRPMPPDSSRTRRTSVDRPIGASIDVASNVISWRNPPSQTRPWSSVHVAAERPVRHQVIRHVGAVARLVDGGASHGQQLAEAGAAIVESGAERPDADGDRRRDVPKVAAGRRRAAVHGWAPRRSHGTRAARHHRSRGRARPARRERSMRRCAPVSAGASSDAARSTRMSVSRVMSSSVSTAVDGLVTWNAPLMPVSCL